MRKLRYQLIPDLTGTPFSPIEVEIFQQLEVQPLIPLGSENSPQVELLDNDGAFLLDNDGAQLLDNQ